MLEAVDAIAAAGFNIQPIAVKARLWKRLWEQASSGGAHQISTVSASCARFLEEAAASGAVDEASEVLDPARNAVAESKKRVLGALRAARLAIARCAQPGRQSGLGEEGRRGASGIGGDRDRGRSAGRLREGPPTRR